MAIRVKIVERTCGNDFDDVAKFLCQRERRGRKAGGRRGGRAAMFALFEPERRDGINARRPQRR